jgi:hypothetical protein
MRSILLLACSCFVLVAIVACHREIPQSELGPPIPWQRDQIVGLNISLQDEESVEQMLFVDEKAVAMTLGSKKSVTAPIFYWKLNDGILVITGTNDVYEELSLISLSPTTLIVKRKNGRIATYAVKHPGK